MIVVVVYEEEPESGESQLRLFFVLYGGGLLELPSMFHPQMAQMTQIFQ